tara:strand:- start:1164 stop:1343 length:180 start_codon:yes stop_codon:yes gene_type:complete
MIAFLQNTPKNGETAYNLGYEIGYFVGDNFYLLLALVLISIAIFFIMLFRKNKKRNSAT